MDKVDLLFHKLETFCKGYISTKIQSDCSNAFESLKSQHSNNLRKFSSISYLLSTSHRVKRGLLDAGGSILKTFFGTLDADDAIKYTDAINQVQSDEKKLAHLMKDNIHVLKSTISNFNNSMNKINSNEYLLNRNFQILNQTILQLTNSSDKLQIKTALNSLINEIESIIMSLSFDIDDVNNAILFSKANILHPTVLSPYQLFNELEQNKNSMPKHCDLPIFLSLNTIHDIIDISSIISFYYLNKLVIVLRIPLVIAQVYELFHVIPAPTAYDSTKPDTFALIAPNKPFVAITNDRMFYAVLDDVDKCKVIPNQCYVCELNNVFSTIANPTCETVLLTEIVDKLPNSCNVKVIRGNIDYFQKLQNNRWLYVQSEPGKGHFSCNRDLNKYEEILFGTGIMSLPKDCKAFFRTLQFTAKEAIESNVTVQISNFNLIQDDCCDVNKINKTLNRLPFVKLTNINDHNSLLQASYHLDDFEKELNKLESEPSHLERYSFHYLSATYIITTLILLCLLFKVRKLLCKPKGSNCCIQIFNQCNNRKKHKTEDHSAINNYLQQKPKGSSSDTSDEEVLAHPMPLKRNIIV